MQHSELKKLLEQLLSLPSETETVEFKEAKESFSFDKIGKYFSALSNEANLKGHQVSWLVFGIKDKPRDIVGTTYRTNRKDLNNLKGGIANKTTNRITFIDIHELEYKAKRVLLFEIPAAPRGIPIAWENHYYGRDGHELSALNLEEIERIRSQTMSEDWSSGIVHEADLSDLDPEALTVARKNFSSKFPDKSVDIEAWNDITFLNKAKITQKGKITRTALLLLGKDESEHYLQPADPKIRWLLKDSKGNDKDYELFGPPLLLAVDKIYVKIRNVKYRYIREGTLFPEEVEQYEPFIIREAINNCIAHQDYTLGSRINVVETEDQLIFTNKGSFIPGTVERVVREDAPEEYYRNRFLATAMFNLKMVDTAGGGIRRMFIYQKTRYFPLPDYDLENKRVKVTIIGKVLDLNYARMLAKLKNLTLDEIITLDKVAKHKPISELEENHLRAMKLIEGRKPNYYLAKKVAQITGSKAEYTRNKAFNKQYYFDLICKGIEEHGYMGRKDIDSLLWDKLPDWMDYKQRKNKITNILTELRRNKKIHNQGSDTASKWVLGA